MIEKKRWFYSDGVELAGAFYLPDQPVDASRPLVLPCSGFTGMGRIHPARFSRALTARGWPCFIFDYRGFPPSGGTPGRVLIEEQLRDIRHAAAFASSDEELGPRELVLLGWGMAGGMVLPAARGLSNLRGLVCVNGFYDAQRVQRALRGEDNWQRFCEWVEQDRLNRVLQPDPVEVDPFSIYPLDRVSRRYVDEVLRRVPDYEGDKVHSLFADSLLDFAPEQRLEHLSQTPLLIAHGDANALHPVEEARSLHQRYPGPKQLHWIEGGGHTEWMADDHPLFLALIERISAWLAELG